jgi:RNase adapter protein RapZ
MSFGFKYGPVENADLVIDARDLPNPYWVDELRPLTGRDAAVRAWVLDKDGAKELIEHVVGVVQWTKKDWEAKANPALRVAIGCTGGRHRSVAIAEEVAQRLVEVGDDVRVEHRDVDRVISG